MPLANVRFVDVDSTGRCKQIADITGSVADGKIGWRLRLDVSVCALRAFDVFGFSRNSSGDSSAPGARNVMADLACTASLCVSYGTFQRVLGRDS